MKKRKLISIIFFVVLMVPGIVFADDSYGTIAQISNSLLAALAWVGYAIAVGVLIFIGIKYVMSGANEKANLKGKLITYVIGIGLIVFCSTIAAAVAGTANADGQNDAAGVVDRGFELGGIQVQTAPNANGGAAGNAAGNTPAVNGGGRPGIGANQVTQQAW